ncbi:hypothetical protein R6Q59_031736 [Mikania micrantha]
MSFLEFSQNDSSSDGIEKILSDLLDRSSTRLHYKLKYAPSFVFWSETEGSEMNLSSADQLNTVHDKIKSAFLHMDYGDKLFIGQFWAPVIINDKRHLSTSGQPFVIPVLTEDSVMYRLDSEKHEYDIDAIPSVGPATTFLRRLPNTDHLPESESCFRLNFCIMLPICFPSDQSDCIGVLGLTFQHESYRMRWYFLPDVLKAIKKAGLDICKAQQHIPYETINGLTHAKDKITHALEIVCNHTTWA